MIRYPLTHLLAALLLFAGWTSVQAQTDGAAGQVEEEIQERKKQIQKLLGSIESTIEDGKQELDDLRKEQELLLQDIESTRDNVEELRNQRRTIRAQEIQEELKTSDTLKNMNQPAPANGAGAELVEMTKDLDTRRERIRELEERTRQLEEENRKLKDTLLKADRSINLLQGKGSQQEIIREYTTQIDSLKNQVRVLSGQIQTLRNDSTGGVKKLETLRNSLKTEEARNAQLQREKDEMAAQQLYRIGQFEKQISDLKTQMKGLQDYEGKAGDEIANLKKTIEDMATSAKGSIDREKDLKARLDAANDQLSDARKMHEKEQSAADKEIVALRKEINGLNETLKSAQTAESKAKDEAKALEASFKKRVSEKEAALKKQFDDKLAAAQQAELEATEKVKTMENTFNHDLLELRTARADLKSENFELKKTVIEQGRELERRQQVLTEARQALEALKSSEAEAGARVLKYEKDLIKMADELNTLRKQREQALVGVNQLKEKAEELIAAVKKKDAMNQQLAASNKRLEADLASAKTAQTKAEKELASAKAILGGKGDLEKQLAQIAKEKETAIAQLEEQLTRMQKESSDATTELLAKVSTLEESNAKLAEEKAALAKQVDSMQSASSAMQKAMNERSKQAKLLEQDLANAKAAKEAFETQSKATLEGISVRLKDLQAKVGEVETERSRLEELNRMLSEKLTESVTKLASMQKALDETTANDAKLAEQAAAMAALKEEAAAKGTELAAVKAEKEALAQSQAQLQAQLASAKKSEAMVNDLQQQVATMQSRLTATEQELVGAKATSQQQAARMAALQAAAQDAQDTLAKTDTRYNELNELLKGARRNADIYENAAKEAEVQLAALKQLNAQLTSETSDLKSQIFDLSKEVNDRDEKISKLQSGKNVRVPMVGGGGDAQKMQLVNRELKSMLQERDNMIDYLKKQLSANTVKPGDDPEQLKKAFEYERDTRMKLEREVSTLNKKIMSLEKRLNKAGDNKSGGFGLFQDGGKDAAPAGGADMDQYNMLIGQMKEEAAQDKQAISNLSSKLQEAVAQLQQTSARVKELELQTGSL